MWAVVLQTTALTASKLPDICWELIQMSPHYYTKLLNELSRVQFVSGYLGVKAVIAMNRIECFYGFDISANGAYCDNAYA